MSDERKVFKVLKFLLATLINEAITTMKAESHVTESFIGRKITPAKIPELKNAIMAAFSEGTPKSEDDDPNPQSE